MSFKVSSDFLRSDAPQASFQNYSSSVNIVTLLLKIYRIVWVQLTSNRTWILSNKSMESFHKNIVKCFPLVFKFTLTIIFR